MLALRKPFRRIGLAVWHSLFCLTVIAFLCRAVIPVGYMPDGSQERGQAFAITLCIPEGGTSTMLMALTAAPEQSYPEDQAGNQECPFALVVSQDLLPLQVAPMVAGAITHWPLLHLHHNRSLPPLPALGPPLGPRAPPSSLV